MKPALSLTLLAVAAGAALTKLAHLPLLAALPGEVIFAATASLAIVGIAIADYARHVRPLTIKGPVARIALPPAGPRSQAYGIRRRTSALVERSAA